VVADANGRVESVNPAYTRITGFREDEVIGTKQHIFAVKDAASVPPEALQLSLDTEGHWQGEVWNRRKNGESFLEWKSINKIVDAGGRVEHYVSVFSDITDFWRRDEEVRRLAFHDALTDLPNRALLTERLTQLLAMAQREKRNLAVLFMDLDGFKHVNDTLGHEVGDHVLIAAAKHLQALVRAADTVARVGGDEFVVVLDNPQDNDEVALIATRIIDQVNEPLTINGRTVQVGTSIGIAIHPTAGRTVDELVRSADAAMYAAKKAGKNAFKFAGSPQL
jgi:diguanylate cyclase (GGDEF)-like protein/PAS domain S-box-containing protein